MENNIRLINNNNNNNNRNNSLDNKNNSYMNNQDKNYGRFNSSNESDINKLKELIMDGLGMKIIPNVNQINISQMEYSTKYNEYLTRVHNRRRRELLSEFDNENYFLDDFKTLTSIPHNISDSKLFFQNKINSRAVRSKRSISSHGSDVVYIRFPLRNENQTDDDIEEANLRLMLITEPNQNHTHQHPQHQYHHHRMYHAHHNVDEKILHLKVYQILKNGKIWLDSREIMVDLKMKSSNWLEFDVTKAVQAWLKQSQDNLGLEIHCDLCHKIGAYIIDDSSNNLSYDYLEEDDINNDEQIRFPLKKNLSGSVDEDLSPVLNIIGRMGSFRREKRSRQHHHVMMPPARKKRKTDCYEGNQRCCRHQMEVVFREIKGFEFIIQPKIFDAGYCRGKCPPRYNPAHHHAVLQSLIWKQDRSKAPRPCCAPSKLVELEILHVDEKDPRKLTVSTWADMKVIECACS